MKVELLDPFGTVIATADLEFLPDALMLGEIVGGSPRALKVAARPMTRQEQAELLERITGRGGEFDQRRPINVQLPYRIKVSTDG